jgi:copper chaperone NosL
MRPRSLFRVFLTILLISAIYGCGKDEQESPPPPKAITGDAIAEFCNMALSEHSGPKGQIFVQKRPQPYWFASVRDTFAFVMLPEEPKDITAIYVSDMAKSKNWSQPEVWTDARKAVFVIGSRKRGGMGEDEAVPFSDKAAAQAFAAENGGRIVNFDEMPKDYILPNGNVASTADAHSHDTNGAKDSGMSGMDMKNMGIKEKAP